MSAVEKQSSTGAQSPVESNQQNRGINRSQYVFGIVCAVTLSAFLHSVGFEGSFGGLISGICILWLSFARMRNIGSNPLRVLLMLIPIVNFFVLMTCLSSPPGFARTHKLDKPGEIITGIFMVIAAIVIIAVIYFAFFMKTNAFVTVHYERTYITGTNGMRVQKIETIPWTNGFTLGQAVARAGGYSAPPHRYIYLIRKRTPALVADLRSSRSELETVPLLPGDQIELSTSPNKGQQPVLFPDP